MFKKLVFTLISALFVFTANAGQMANVEYIHQLIKQEHGIDIKYAPDLISPRQAANMKYLLTAVDVANEILNGEKTTDYGNGEFATRVAVDTIATIQAVRTLIKQENQFIIHTTPDTQTFGFDLRARGNFTIDWGDGTVQTVNKEWADNTWNCHEYATAGEYTIKLTGLATAYSENSWDPVVKFWENKNIARLSGSLGKIFPTMDSGRSPSFNEAFIGCSNLTEIPENLFRGIATTTEAMFRKTFDGCTGLTEIPENLFAGFKTFTPYMFNSTFAGCTGLTEIPAGLFAKLSGEPKRSMFDGTFYGCTNLTEIPDGLFASVTGAPAEYMFGYTFMNCSNLSGEIPGDLFANIAGAPAEHMFHSTFEGCRGLTGIGDGLFSGIVGAPAAYMFNATFHSCSGLSELPDGLFAGISGNPADWMFGYAFYGCSGLNGIPLDTFGEFTNEWASSGMFDRTFAECTNMIGESGKSGDKYLYEIWPDAMTFAYENASGLLDYNDIPTNWGGPVQYVFTATTTDDTTYFEFTISAAGKFYVDWGDGNIEKVDKDWTGEQTISHYYNNAGAHEIKLGGKATGYTYRAAILFKYNMNLAKIDGSLGQIFSTLSDGTQPRFSSTDDGVGTFWGCSNLSGSIPENLFAGITGAPASYMFRGTFASCSGLTGSIPENLFAGIIGTPARMMFDGTFNGCSGLTGSIPENLFTGIEGAPAVGMFSDTFSGCSGLTGSIPENLFAGVSGVPAEWMFVKTFYDCSGLTGSIPEKLFAGIEGAPAEYMFYYTFSGCSGLSGNIPENLFAGITGAPAEYMFSHTFYGCSGLSGYIPPELFAGIGTDTTASEQMSSVFYNTVLDTTCPVGTIQYMTGFEDWFNGRVSCEPFVFEPKFTATTTPDTTTFSFDISAKGRFLVDWGDGSDVQVITRTSTSNETYTHTYNTAGEYQIKIDGKATGYGSYAAISFYQNQNLAKIDGSLGQIFSTLSDGTQPRFGSTSNWRGTFQECTNLTGEIPAELFSGIYGAPAYAMFFLTFEGCSNLSGNIPENLFAGISGAPESYMFYRTFRGCSGFSGSIPENLFAGIKGVPANHMFSQTFDGCSGLSGYIPPKLFAGIGTDITATNQMSSVFSGTGLDTTCPSGTIKYTTGFESWFDGRVSCEPFVFEPKFTATTTPDTTTFSFDISAKGRFLVDWGDGSDVQVITRTSTSNETYTHTYATAGEYQIKFDGKATGYGSYAAISFFQNQNLAKIDGSLGQIFSTLSDGSQPRFGSSRNYRGTFQGCTNLTGEIPAELFSGISGAPASSMFSSTFSGCSGLTGTIPENLFAGVKGAPAEYMFSSTFSGCSGLTGNIPENLFAGIKGAPASGMFYFTFYGCSNLSGSIPENLFAGIEGAPAFAMFYYTFDGCSRLTGSIPENLFAGVSGAPAEWMFNGTFYGCSGLSGNIPENLFAGIMGAPASNMFTTTFSGCSGLTGSIPENLFAGITGAPARAMFSYTFYGCSGLTGSIPENLFAGVSGAPAEYMFYYTFEYCSGLTGNIPGNLFAGIKGAPASYMFTHTFSVCSGLSGNIPENLFAGITGAPAERMFSGTFFGCSGLSGNIPENLFAGITGAPASNMFSYTFAACWGLTGYIPPKLFAGISTDTTADYQMQEVFYNTGLDTTCPSGTVQYTTGFESWFSGKVSCEPFVFEPKFTATTTPDTTTFSFDISAAGQFLVDWGDGSDVQVITRTSTSNETYTHTYNTAGEYQIKFDGKSTGYGSYAAISFFQNQNLAKIDGSLGMIFSTLSDGTQPRFGSSSNWRGTFQGCTNLTGEIPAELFSGISGAPASSMFSGTFDGCSGLSGSIPGNLFAGVSGAPASRMFFGTFRGCSGLTGNIPENLFAGIAGAPASYMFDRTFYGCSGLSGNIPEKLFAGISGAPAEDMFYSTFYDCSNLTGSIPENLFAGIKGAPANYMFSSTFRNCSGLTGYIPPKLFAGIGTDTTATKQMSNVFRNTGLDTTCPLDMKQYITGFEDYFDGKVSCEPLYDFTATTTPDTTNFSFNISAAGTFLIDWGDGTIEEFTKTNTINTRYYHKYTTAGEYKIGLTGNATGYNNTEAAISFSDNKNLAKIDGSLGAIFSTLSNGTQPRFGNSTNDNNLYGLFQNCTNLTGAIPENLFAGVYGAPVRDMFFRAFFNCYNLTGPIPENLFAGIKGAPVRSIFGGTFYGCSKLSGNIPGKLFAGISGAPANRMFQSTFMYCKKLTGYIPAELFAGLTYGHEERIFENTFTSTGLATSCPSGTQRYTTVFGSSFDGKAVCQPI